MIKTENFPLLLTHLGFQKTEYGYTKNINGFTLSVDFVHEKLVYPEGLKAHRDTTKNFSAPENFVVFECVYNLLQAGYQPEHIILEQGMPGGHGMTGGFCDIIVQDNDGKEYLLIECKTADSEKSKEFSKAWAKMEKDGGQLFNYYNSYRAAQWICLYTSDFYNDKIVQNYHLISMQDNQDYLKNNNKLASFAKVKEENGSKADYFRVWRDTYQQDFISHNLFESEAFNIGNRPYNVGDLKVVDNDTIQKKYHQFATILRQHNVSARENAFDKLVNLFLCKVVDEKHNPDNLKVYWKGAASDDHYSLQDRLQYLYQIGMKDFLGEDVTYISEEQLDNAFYLFKNQKDETKRTVLSYFTQLKFYSNNPFAFLDVHNEKLFFQNAVILKEIVQMLQDIKLKNENEQHQFLGDLFEGFLDQGVKQSEGQFFTPTPIVKFLISSLPLSELLNSEKAPKVIDYACGAGHFLTEYANQIKALLPSGRNPSEFYQQIYGIEKEYRLSKVAKVSAFMYGQDEMNIVYADALAQHSDSQLKNGTFSLIVANPPYSVKGFLKTLTDDEKAQFSLYPQVSDEETFRAIETFFIEKAEQLLASDGIAVIVLPSSILTNGNIYIKCREILLAKFELVAIAEFGSGTFGKTGTNTATLFLRRRSRQPDLSQHYKNRVNQWQVGNFGLDSLFEDVHLLKAYCQHTGIDFNAYLDFLKTSGEIPSQIAQSEVFKEYRKAFDKKKRNKNADLATEWLAFCKEIEADKLHYFMLAKSQSSDVLIIKMPSDKKEKKAFLGYEWSDSKGSEGIKYLADSRQESDDDDENFNRNGINQINTPLFNPQNLFDESKINSLIRQHFGTKPNQQAVKIPENLASYVSLLPLADMLDFERVEFDKVIRTSVKSAVKIESKFPIVNLADFPADIRKGKSITAKNTIEGNYKVVAGGKDFAYMHNEYNRDENTITISASGANAGFVNFWAEKIFASDCTTVRAETDLGTKYIFAYLQSIQQNIFDLARGAAQPHVYPDDIKQVKIPLPPLEIQQKIVEECEKIDRTFSQNQSEIERLHGEIESVVASIHGKMTALADITSKIGSGATPLGGENAYKASGIPLIRSQNVYDSRFVLDGLAFIDDEQAKKLDNVTVMKNDILFNITGASVARCCIVPDEFVPARVNQHVAIIRVIDGVLPKYVQSLLISERYKAMLLDIGRGATSREAITKSQLEYFKIPMIDLPEQQKIITQIQAIESQIADLEQAMSQVAEMKKAVLEKWL